MLACLLQFPSHSFQDKNQWSRVMNISNGSKWDSAVRTVYNVAATTEPPFIWWDLSLSDSWVPQWRQTAGEGEWVLPSTYPTLSLLLFVGYLWKVEAIGWACAQRWWVHSHRWMWQMVEWIPCQCMNELQRPELNCGALSMLHTLNSQTQAFIYPNCRLVDTI